MQSIDGLSGGQEAGRAGRLVLLRQRRRSPQGRGRDERASGRSHLVGSARLEPDRRHPRGRRLVPRAVPERHRRQAAAGAHRMRGRRRLRVPHRHRAPARARRVPAAIAAIGSGGGEPQTLRVLVGAVDADRGRPEVRRASSAGPRASGVYARFSADGQHAHAARSERPDRCSTLSAGAGLIAATRSGQDAPVWVVTGTDAAGRRTRRARVRRRDASQIASPSRSRRRARPRCRRPHRERHERHRCSSTGAWRARCTRRAPASGRCWALALTAAALILFHPLVLLALLAARARRGCRRRRRAASSRARCARRADRGAADRGDQRARQPRRA